MEIPQNNKRQVVTIQFVGDKPVFAIFDSKTEAFMALLNLNKDRIMLLDN